MGSDEGRRAVIGGAVAGVRAALAQPAEEQLALGDLLPTRFEGTDAAEQVARVERGRGRPAGAQNKATKEVKAYIQRVLGDPMVEMARWAMHTPQSLAKELGCTTLEAFDRLQAIRKELLPYFYARMAPVDDTGKAVPTFNLQIGGSQVAVVAGPDRPPWEYEQDQWVEEAKAQSSHDAPSHDASKVLK